MVKEKILVSACLLGENCKYNGSNNLNQEVLRLKEKYEIIGFCPEQSGGLSTPRVPSEIRGDYVYSKDGVDVTQHFSIGAINCALVCKDLGIKKAVLKERSPSCGSKFIYDGTFSGKVIEGMGFTTRTLVKSGIDVFSELDLHKL